MALNGRQDWMVRTLVSYSGSPAFCFGPERRISWILYLLHFLKMSGGWDVTFTKPWTFHYRFPPHPTPTAQQRLLGQIFTITLTHTHTHTPGRTPVDEWAARHRDFYVTIHKTHKSQTSMLRRDSNPQSQQMCGHIPTPQTARPLGLAHYRWLPIWCSHSSQNGSSQCGLGFGPYDSLTIDYNNFQESVQCWDFLWWVTDMNVVERRDIMLDVSHWSPEIISNNFSTK